MGMKLFCREYGEDRGGPPLVFIHGLFGSSANWRGIARRFSDAYRVLVPDLRNHGQSPHSDDVSFKSQAADVLALLDASGEEQAVLVGHSMGGKVAMRLALDAPERVTALACVDIAPVSYPGDRFGPIFEAMAAVDPETLASRQQADARLAGFLPARQLRSYLLQNLVKEQDGWRWRLNLGALEQGMQEVSGFDAPADARFLGEALFVYGGNSSYVKPEHAKIIRYWFPYARLRQIAGAGHWVYADEPLAFTNALESFLDLDER
jgi:pimeloyl-ACP methyl ester carboxylesterase